MLQISYPQKHTPYALMAVSGRRVVVVTIINCQIVLVVLVVVVVTGGLAVVEVAVVEPADI